MKQVIGWFVATFAALSAFADPATGWLQTAAGTYSYNDAANWVNGEINGIFGSDLTLTGSQTITFDADTTLPNGLKIGYNGAYSLTFQSSAVDVSENGVPVTLRLQGDLKVNTVMNNGSIIVKFGAGSTDSPAKGVMFDLDGEVRTFSVSQSKVALQVLNKVTNGGLVLDNVGSVRLDNVENDYTLGTTLKGAGSVTVMQNVFGTGPIVVENAVLATSGNRTFTNDNKLILKGWLKFSGANGNLNLGAGEIEIREPEINVEVGKSTLTLGGSVAADSLYGIDALVKWGGGMLSTKASAVSESDLTLTALQGTWAFEGSVVVAGQLSIRGGGQYGSASIRLSSTENAFTGTVPVLGDQNCVSLCFTTEGSLPDGAVFELNDRGTLQSSSPYLCSFYLEGGRIASASTGVLGVGVNGESGVVDLTGVPGLSLGASGGNFRFSGSIVPPEGKLRLGGGPNYLYLDTANVLPAGHEVELLGGVWINAPCDYAGTITVAAGRTCGIDGLGAVPNAEVVVEHQGVFDLKTTDAFDGTAVKKLTLRSSRLNLAGTKGKTVSYRIDELVLEPADQYGGIPQVSWAVNGVNLTLRVGRVTRRYPIPLNFQTDPVNLGLTDFTSGCNILFEDGSATALGVEGSTAAPVVPWVRYNGAFLTYDETRGFRALATSEMENYTSSTEKETVDQFGANVFAQGNGSSEMNLKFTGERTTLTSLRTGYQGKAIRVQSAESAVISIPTGAVFEDGNSSPYIQAAVDFGTARGYIFDRQGKIQVFSGPISGTGGLTLAHYGTSNVTGSSGGPGLTCNFSGSTFTGDVHVFTRLDNPVSGAFPNGADRPGNLYLHGYWICGNSTPFLLNGLYGSGNIVLQNGYNPNITLGCDGSDGDYDGLVTRSNGTLSFTKVGAGRQRFGGTCAHNGATTVSEGALQVDGEFTRSTVSVATGAMLAGCGTFGGAVTLADGAALELGSSKVGAADSVMGMDGGLTLSGNAAFTFKVLGKTTLASLEAASIVGEGTVTVNLDSTDLKQGEYLIVKSESGAIPFTAVRGTNCGGLMLKNNDTELWMGISGGLVVTLR